MLTARALVSGGHSEATEGGGSMSARVTEKHSKREQTPKSHPCALIEAGAHIDTTQPFRIALIRHASRLLSNFQPNTTQQDCRKLLFFIVPASYKQSVKMFVSTRQ